MSYKIDYYDGFKTEDIENDPVFEGTLLKSRYELHVAWNDLKISVINNYKQSWGAKLIKTINSKF